ncbi:MAG: division/cell wall cluster transcriptional repressor MraZ [gamma proteobacterium symbiont of Lucinoma myriamae]|nr:division/cell wall cluster transcriptional repressor MraZ [gamma proteobacterium symbiont of Lucinoma myriamae]MCU7818964.1 division/cell wall cluster transcriptional repressor MraZ [gamma proteobacterium symbiont of Lucinoma myriamae]MCU7833484.1 division/cell wall cluster transcriptional repressor MraZ [gamma proteobacterium symbiont of Lucinoma myriamae]
MLNGVTKLNLDAKGRMAIPSRYRERLVDDCAGHVVITLDTEKRVVIYPHNKWKEVETKLANLPVNKAAVRIQRLYLGHAADCDMDKNGRINIPPYLREITGLNKQIVLVGIGNKFEVWDEDSWNREWEDDEELELPAELDSLSL